MLIQLIEHVVMQLVSQPDVIEVKETEQDGKPIIQIIVDPDDLKRVIGKEGRVIKSLRHMARAAGLKDEYDIILHATSES